MTFKQRKLSSSAGTLAITHRRLDDLHPSPNNPRQHKNRQIQALARSIEAFGFNVPLLVNARDEIIAGHGRYLAAQRLGLTSVPVIRLEHLTPEQTQAFRIADNRLTELSAWDDALLAEQLQTLAQVELDFSLEATGFTVGEIDLRIEGLDAGAPPDPADESPPLAEIAVSVPGDLWALGDHRLLCGNAMDPAAYPSLMAGTQANMVFSDPPYNVPIDGFVGGKGKIHHREFAMGVGEMSSAEFIQFLSTVFAHLTRVCRPEALAYLCMDWRHMSEILAAGQAAFNELKHLCIWAKDRPGMGSFYRSQHELIFIFKTGAGKSRNNVELGRHGRHRSNVWSYPSVLNSRHGEEGDLLALHPTVKPLRLVADAILDVTAPNDIVLDVFLGSGTTLMACQRVGRRCYGMELDPRYVDVAVRRWRRDTGADAVHVSSGQSFTTRENQALRRAAKKGGHHG